MLICLDYCIWSFLNRFFFSLRICGIYITSLKLKDNKFITFVYLLTIYEIKGKFFIMRRKNCYLDCDWDCHFDRHCPKQKELKPARPRDLPKWKIKIYRAGVFCDGALPKNLGVPYPPSWVSGSLSVQSLQLKCAITPAHKCNHSSSELSLI